MSCFFCNSNFHLSEYCNIYISDESRLDIALSKECCRNCLTKNTNLKKPNHVRSKRRYICYNEKCYICFSRGFHSTAFCPNRFLNTAPIPPPKIDADLLPRLIKMSNAIEQFLLAFYLSPKTIDKNGLRQFVIVENLGNYILEQYTDVLVTSEVNLSRQELAHLELENIFFKQKQIIIHNSTFFSRDFLQILSSTVEQIFCSNLTFIPEITFEEILARIPNIRSIHFRNVNIEFDDFWANDLLNCNCKKLEEIDISINNNTFDVESLAEAMKKQKIEINLYIPRKGKNLTTNLSKFFVPVVNLNRSKESILKIRNFKNIDLYEPLEPKIE